MGIDMNHNTKNNRTSSDPMDKMITVRIDTGGKGGRGSRGVKSFLPIYPLPVFLL